LSESDSEKLLAERIASRTRLLDGGVSILKWICAAVVVALIAFCGVFVGYVTCSPIVGWPQVVGLLGVLASLVTLLLIVVSALTRLTRMDAE
jgi:Ni,Fe-hydrogenase I cytochrome b subunit